MHRSTRLFLTLPLAFRAPCRRPEAWFPGRSGARLPGGSRLGLQSRKNPHA